VPTHYDAEINSSRNFELIKNNHR